MRRTPEKKVTSYVYLFLISITNDSLADTAGGLALPNNRMLFCLLQ
jgi:hypothetical protein